jgi:hypothetical protein
MGLCSFFRYSDYAGHHISPESSTFLLRNGRCWALVLSWDVMEEGVLRWPIKNSTNLVVGVQHGGDVGANGALAIGTGDMDCMPWQRCLREQARDAL